MARLEQLVEGVQDEQLRRQIEAEIAALKERTRFGLVYERHLPETALIADPDLVEVGAQVRLRKDVDKDVSYRVVGLKGKTKARLVADGNGKELEALIKDLFVVKPFGEPIYPTLTPVGVVERSSERPHHAVVNGENFHALQLLAYLYEKQVDCLYLDPPYNSGARDWKYNNRYVDNTDSYRHSKWLSMMEKRLRIAKRLLKDDGVLIITIDENEVHHLGVLLEDVFPEYLRYMITIVINPKGTAKVNFSRVEEYALFLVPETGSDVIEQLRPRVDQVVADERAPAAEDDQLALAEDGEEADVAEDSDDVAAAEVHTANEAAFSVLYLRRRGAESSYREARWRQFYAIYVDEETKQPVGVGPLIEDLDEHPRNYRDGKTLAIYPVDSEGNERVWRYGRETMEELITKAEIRVGRYNKQQNTYTLNHWKPIPKDKVGLRRVRTVWWETRHDAGTHGTTLLANLLGRRKAFPFPKSLYAVRDALETVVKNRPNALIVDFFAGSGTTMHATALLNSEDGGSRRCILVTNNEVDPKTTRRLNKAGHFRGDKQFEAEGIFETATLPRCKAAITGKRPDGTPMPNGKKYSYIDGRPFSEGFEENAVFFRLNYMNPDVIELGDGFNSIHPLLWLAAGGRGPSPGKLDALSKEWFVSQQGGYAVLFAVAALRDLEQELVGRDDITHLYVITDSPDAFAEVREALGQGRQVSMLYRDYLRNFRINTPQSV